MINHVVLCKIINSTQIDCIFKLTKSSIITKKNTL